MNQIILILLYCLAILISIIAIRLFCYSIQKEIEKNQKKILSDNRKNQRKLMRDLKAKSANPSGKRASFLQRYRYKKSSGDSFFLSQ